MQGARCAKACWCHSTSAGPSGPCLLDLDTDRLGANGLIANILGCAALATVLWTLIGLPLAARVAPPSLVWPMAPAWGWAVRERRRAAAVLHHRHVAAGRAGGDVAVCRRRRRLALDFAVGARGGPSRRACLGCAGDGGAAGAGADGGHRSRKSPPDGVALAEPIFDHSRSPWSTKWCAPACRRPIRSSARSARPTASPTITSGISAPP